MSDPTVPVTPSIPPADPPGRPAGPARRPRRRRPGADRDRARDRDRPRLRSRRAGRRRWPTPSAIPFADLPGWPAATAPGHAGRLLLGTLGRPAGGHAPGSLPPVRGQRPGPRGPAGAAVPRPRGADRGPDQRGRRPRPVVRAGHAHGHARPHQPDRSQPADRARTPTTLGPRFPDMTDAWSPRLRERLHAAGVAEGVRLEEGVYVGLTGPTYETPAEVRMLAGARRPRRRHVDRARMHRRPLGRARGLRRVARDQRRRGLQRRAADPRGGPGGGQRPARAWRGSCAGSSPTCRPSAGGARRVRIAARNEPAQGTLVLMQLECISAPMRATAAGPSDAIDPAAERGSCGQGCIELHRQVRQAPAPPATLRDRQLPAGRLGPRRSSRPRPPGRGPCAAGSGSGRRGC